MFAAGEGGFEVAFEDGGEGFLVFPFRVLGGEGLDAVEGEEGLEVHGLFAPERAVVVEDGDTLCGGNEVGGVWGGDFGDEGGDGLFGCGVLP